MFAKANINGITQCRDSSSNSMDHTIVICKGSNIKSPATRSTSQKYQSIVTQKIQQKFLHIGKCLGTPMFYITSLDKRFIGVLQSLDKKFIGDL